MNATAFWANFSKVAKTMTNSTEQPAKLKSHETRHRNTERRIRQAMDRLVAQASLEGRTTRVTVAALAREAQVSRNTIYAEHSSFLEELASANPPRPELSDRLPNLTCRYFELRCMSSKSKGGCSRPRMPAC